jgi:hypothetical protein
VRAPRNARRLKGVSQQPRHRSLAYIASDKAPPMPPDVGVTSCAFNGCYCVYPNARAEHHQLRSIEQANTAWQLGQRRGHRNLLEPLQTSGQSGSPSLQAQQRVSHLSFDRCERRGHVGRVFARRPHPQHQPRRLPPSAVHRRVLRVLQHSSPRSRTLLPWRTLSEPSSENQTGYLKATFRLQALNGLLG